MLLSVGVCYENRQCGRVVEPTISFMNRGGASFQRWAFHQVTCYECHCGRLGTFQAAAKLQTTYKKKVASPLKLDTFFPLPSRVRDNQEAT